MPKSDTEDILDDVQLSKDEGIVNEGFGDPEDSYTPGDTATHDAKRVRKLWKWNLEGMTLVVLSVIVLSFAITVALIIHIILGGSEVTPHAIVASESQICTQYGSEVLQRFGGNAVDAAVATVLCITIARPDKASLAGCGLMLVSDRNRHENHLYDFMCPASSSPVAPDDAKPETTVGIPGLIRGLHAAHEKFGKRPWYNLFAGAIKLASNGFTPDPALLASAKALHQTFPASSIISELASYTGGVYQPSAALKDTLLSLARDGPNYFYRRESAPVTFADRLLTHMTNSGQQWSTMDLSDYVVQQPKPIQMGFAGFTLDTFPAPSAGGPYLLSLLGNLDLKNAILPLDAEALSKSDINATGTMLHRILELSRISEYSAYKLGDPYDPTIAAAVLKAQNALFSPESRRPLVNGISDVAVGTTNIPPNRTDIDIGDTGILATDSMQFTVIVSLFMGAPFGTGTLVPNTGVHLNSALRLFPRTPQPPGTLNVFGPRRRPLAPVTPIYMSATHRKCGVRVGLATSGGLWGVMDSAQVIASAALFLRGATCTPPASMPAVVPKGTLPGAKKHSVQSNHSPAADNGCINAQAAIDLERIHSRVPVVNASAMLVETESAFSQLLLSALEGLGHQMQRRSGHWPGRVIIGGWNGYTMIPSADNRRSWYVDTF